MDGDALEALFPLYTAKGSVANVYTKGCSFSFTTKGVYLFLWRRDTSPSNGEEACSLPIEERSPLTFT